jgi:hypothetical protein
VAKKQKPELGANLQRGSVCTPTHNRRIFIPPLIQCFEAQNYPRELMKWIVTDDGSDPLSSFGFYQRSEAFGLV